MLRGTTSIRFLTTKGTREHQGLENALCGWPAPAYAVTGIPVTVYSACYMPFFVICIRRLQRCFPVDAFTVRILRYQVPKRLLLLNVRIISS